MIVFLIFDLLDFFFHLFEKWLFFRLSGLSIYAYVYQFIKYLSIFVLCFSIFVLCLSDKINLKLTNMAILRKDIF